MIRAQDEPKNEGREQTYKQQGAIGTAPFTIVDACAMNEYEIEYANYCRGARHDDGPIQKDAEEAR
jgi:hypothetical protein